MMRFRTFVGQVTNLSYVDSIRPVELPSLDDLVAIPGIDSLVAYIFPRRGIPTVPCRFCPVAPREPSVSARAERPASVRFWAAAAYDVVVGPTRCSSVEPTPEESVAAG